MLLHLLIHLINSEKVFNFFLIFSLDCIKTFIVLSSNWIFAAMAVSLFPDTNSVNIDTLSNCSTEHAYNVDLQCESQISIAWKNLRFEATNWGFKKKAILKRLNGYFETGTLNGLMGPSGAVGFICIYGLHKLNINGVIFSCFQNRAKQRYFNASVAHLNWVSWKTLKYTSILSKKRHFLILSNSTSSKA